MIVTAVPKEADPSRDRKWTDPQAFVRDLKDNVVTERSQELVNGPIGWLPDADWAPLKRRVYRFEAALKTKNNVAILPGCVSRPVQHGATVS